MGQYSSLAIGVDGLGIVSYYDATNKNLKVAHCSNVHCSEATITTLDSTGDVGLYTSITISAQGFPFISYYDATNDDLKVVPCLTQTCSSGIGYTRDSAGGLYTSSTLGSDGALLTTYYDLTNGHLKIHHCLLTGNGGIPERCAIAGELLDGTGKANTSSYPTSVTLGADGLPLIAYYDTTNTGLKVTHCANVFCSPYFRRR